MKRFPLLLFAFDLINQVNSMRIFTFLLLLNLFNVSIFSQTNNSAGTVTIGLFERLSSLDALTSTMMDQGTERLRILLFNSLVKKDEKLDYVGDLAQQIKTSENGKTITFILRDDIKFHDGKLLTSADVKYTFDELFKSNSYKRSVFFETADGNQIPVLTGIETPNSSTINFVLSRGSLRNLFLSYLVMIPIIPDGSAVRQKTQPNGTGPFKFIDFNQKENLIHLQANTDYFEGAPKIQNIRIKTLLDPTELQTKLQSGEVDLAYPIENLPPKVLDILGQDPKLRLEQFNGSNIVYLGYNTQSSILKNVKVRRAIAYAIDRQRIINEVLDGQAKIAHSMLPVESWAYSEATKYDYNPERAKQLLKQAGYKKERILFSVSSGNVIVFKYIQVVQSMLREIGLRVEIETLEPSALRTQLVFGQFQMTTGRWVGGNQDPLFLKDLFWSGAIPGRKSACCNRSRYINQQFDQIIEQAVETADREKARILYADAQTIVNNDMPVLPLWYPANIIVYNKRISNIKISSDGDWNFVKDLTVNDE
jgi:peptide/nickel transport system substrate-binding protein